ncbi:MAG: hypothetical protein A3H68_02430 [Candidatus Taylorbacteria bacterium RIFCSPLOWO2_02_FULL_46_40]|uniref:Uncharacterized protein n=1 Tax=Candidatus Taylorbacteria bacterium RIFCSPLOWO2_02_FULL_46_40 TaxID=1802329 RepID=A0A1G2P0T5_9BACT|nr:MAG: hypothetical protein A3H68_02430 [Candidatus Taylorbacteria bacterium RIFCSPLOWO2_02_FULL_46_40]
MKVVIQRSKLLDPVFLAWTEKSYPGTTLFPDSEVDERVRLFREIWLDKGELVTRILEKETGLRFPNKEYICHIVNRTHRNLSSPLVIRSRLLPEEFVVALTHELIHILFRENTQLISVNDLKTVFSVEDDCVARHIPVYAILRQLKKEMRDLDFQEPVDNNTNTAYRVAWDFVEKKGADFVLRVVRLATKKIMA